MLDREHSGQTKQPKYTTVLTQCSRAVSPIRSAIHHRCTSDHQPMSKSWKIKSKESLCGLYCIERIPINNSFVIRKHIFIAVICEI